MSDPQEQIPDLLHP